MTYAQQAADEAGMPRQTWCRKVWGLTAYEAKDLLKGNASETVWERILKLKGRHGGWEVALPVTASVIGESVSDYFRRTIRQAAKEAAHAEEHERLAAAALRRLAADPATAGPSRLAAPAVGEAWDGAGEVGDDTVGRLGGLTAQAGRTGRG